MLEERGALGGFANLRLHKQRDVAADLSCGAGEDRQFRAEAREAVARAMPWHQARAQVEFARECRRYLFASPAESRERSARTAELKRAGFIRRATQRRQRACDRC
jgi:hypothetical protein